MTTAMLTRCPLALAGVLTLSAATPAVAETRPGLLTLNLAEALSQPESGDAGAAPPEEAATDGEWRRPEAYGRAGSRWLSFGAGVANDFSDNTDFKLTGTLSFFLADAFEFGVEAGGWYFNQEGRDTGGVSGSMLLRWHFAHAADWKWSVFADAGVGLLAGFDEVPDGGTEFNFLPRLGLGYTRAFQDSVDGESRGARWLVGVRWHHISNARIEGDARNPARDGLMGYFEIVFPF